MLQGLDQRRVRTVSAYTLGSSQGELAANSLTHRAPAWRRQMRSKVFKTALLICLCYSICWLPYNFLDLLAVISLETFKHFEIYTNWLQCLLYVNMLLNPLLYTFG